MTDLLKFSDAIIEKQEIILNSLTDLPYKELVKMMASLSAIISNLDKIQTTEEIKCNKIIADQFSNDPRASFAKVEALMKSSETYAAYKNTLNLKQSAMRELQIVRIQVQYHLKITLDNEPSPL